jgi:hypothetical protein
LDQIPPGFSWHFEHWCIAIQARFAQTCGIRQSLRNGVFQRLDIAVKTTRSVPVWRCVRKLGKLGKVRKVRDTSHIISSPSFLVCRPSLEKDLASIFSPVSL